MKIFVTGGAGFIGSHVVDRYIGEGHTVVVMDNLSTGLRQNVHQKAIFYEGDITSPQLLEIFQKEKPDIVNHHAAQMNVRHSLEDPLYDARANILGTINVLSCCVKMHVKRFLFISSGGAIYGPAPIPTPETHTPYPLSPYGLSKYVGEQYIQLYSRLFGLSYVILRYANVYGFRQNPKSEAGVIAIFIDKMKRGEEPLIFGDGNQTRDYVYVKDIARANVLALTKGENQIINLGTGKETSVNTLFSLLKKEICFQKKALYGEEIIGEIRAGALNITRAQNILDWQPTYSLESGLHKTVEDNIMEG